MSEEKVLTKEENADRVIDTTAGEAVDTPLTSEPAATDIPDEISVEITEEVLDDTTEPKESETVVPLPEEAPPVPEFDEPEENYVFPDEDKPAHKFLHAKPHDEKEFSRDEWILSQLDKEDLMEYLVLEQKRGELDKQLKETREKRLFSAFQLTVSLAAVVAVVYLLQDNPTILVNILYIAGIVAGLWLWKNPKGKK